MSRIDTCLGLHGAGLDTARLHKDAKRLKGDYETAAIKHLNKYKTDGEKLIQRIKEAKAPKPVEPNPDEIPELTAARQALAEIDDQPVTFQDADGTTKTVTFKELMDEADADLKDIPLIKQATQAAITCFLRFGDNLT